MRVAFAIALLAGAFFTIVSAWSKDDHEIFRVRDEVVANDGPEATFYDLLGVKVSASLDEINKAYHKKSRQLHPDKVRQTLIASRASKKKTGKKPTVHVNKPPSEREIQKALKQAHDRFTRLGIVKDILRGPGRDRYDYFLKNGFPTWRGTGYYYTRFRPGLGTVLVGLFLFGGGAVHYGILVLSYKRQREFVQRYVRQARRAAWGDDSGLGGIPGLGASVTTAAQAQASEPENGGAAMNRKQKRQMEKENKKEKHGKRSNNASGTATPERIQPNGGQKREVEAENGKKLVVDSAGNVFLKEEDELFLLDVDEIEPPTFRDTAVYRAPIWLYHKLTRRFTPTDPSEAEEEEESPKAKGRKSHANGKSL